LLGVVKKMNDSVIQIINITKSYFDGNRDNFILLDLNYNILQGDYIVMGGRSGLGKSTFLRIVGALEKPNSGKIVIRGKNIVNLSDKELTLIRRKDIGFVFQQFCLISRFSIHENLELSLFFSGIPQKEREEKISKTLNILGLSQKTSFQKVSSLSGGEKQRIAIGRALINNPAIILADEPTGSLDETNEDQVLEIFDYINKELNTTLLVVTHNDKVANRANKRITLINKTIFQYAGG